MSDFLKTAHIQVEYILLRVYVDDVEKIPFEEMDNDDSKPKFIEDISKSSDTTRNNSSILIRVSDEYEIEVLNDWINKFI